MSLAEYFYPADDTTPDKGGVLRRGTIFRSRCNVI